MANGFVYFDPEGIGRRVRAMVAEHVERLIRAENAELERQANVLLAAGHRLEDLEIMAFPDGKKEVRVKMKQPVEPSQVVEFTYKNHRGETRQRRVIPSAIWFGATEWHKEKQWLLLAVDQETGQERDFAMKEITGWRS